MYIVPVAKIKKKQNSVAPKKLKMRSTRVVAVACLILLFMATARADLVAYYSFENSTDPQTRLCNNDFLQGATLEPGAQLSTLENQVGTYSLYVPSVNGSEANLDTAVLDLGSWQMPQNEMEPNSISVFVWAKLDVGFPRSYRNDSDRFIIEHEFSYFLRFESDGRLRARIEIGAGELTGSTNSNPLPATVYTDWNHWGFTYNGSTLVLYQNGQELRSNQLDIPFVDNLGTPLTLGNRRQKNRALGGYIDDLRIYNVALTEGEVQDVYETTATLVEPAVLPIKLENLTVSNETALDGRPVYTVDVDSSLDFIAEVAGSGNESFRWSFFDPDCRPVVTFDQVENITTRVTANIITQDVDIRVCVKDKLAVLNRAQLRINRRSPAVVADLSPVSEVVRGVQTSLRVQADGNPEPSFQWQELFVNKRSRSVAEQKLVDVLESASYAADYHARSRNGGKRGSRIYQKKEEEEEQSKEETFVDIDASKRYFASLEDQMNSVRYLEWDYVRSGPVSRKLGLEYSSDSVSDDGSSDDVYHGEQDIGYSYGRPSPGMPYHLYQSLMRHVDYQIAKEEQDEDYGYEDNKERGDVNATDVFVAIAGATEATYTFTPTDADNGKILRVLIFNSFGDIIYSEETRLSVSATPTGSRDDGDGAGGVAGGAAAGAIGFMLLVSCAICCCLLFIMLCCFFILAVALLGAGKKILEGQGDELKKLVEPDYHALMFGDFCDAQYEDLRSHAGYLESELQSVVLNMPTALLILAHAAELDSRAACGDVRPDSLCKAFCTVYGIKGRAADLVIDSITHEVAKSKSEHLLFRENSISTKLFNHFAKFCAMPYVWRTLAVPLNRIHDDALKSGVYDIETNTEVTGALNTHALMEATQSKDLLDSVSFSPRTASQSNNTKSGSGGDVDEDEYLGSDLINIMEVQLNAQKILKAILVSGRTIPIPLAATLAHTCEELRSNRLFSEEAAFRGMGGFFFLRLICPAISSPLRFGILAEPPHPSVQYKYVMLAKIMQNLANNTMPSKKTPNLEQLDAFVLENNPRLDTFYEGIIETATMYERRDDNEEEGADMRDNFCVIPDDTPVLNAHATIHHYCREHLPELCSLIKAEQGERAAEHFQTTIEDDELLHIE